MRCYFYHNGTKAMKKKIHSLCCFVYSVLRQNYFPLGRSMIFKSKILHMNKQFIPFFVFIALFFFLFLTHFPLLSQAGSLPSSQSGSKNPVSDLNSLKNPSSVSKSEATSLFVKALEATEKKDFKTAKQNFERLIFNYPQNQKTSISYLYLGKIYEQEESLHQAKTTYNKFIKQYPDHQLLPEILSRQAEIYLQLGEIKRAQKIFKQLLFQYPHTSFASEASFRLGNYAYKLNDAATARLYYYEGIKKLPKYLHTHPQTALNIGCLYLEDRHFDQALRVFTDIEKKFPDTEFSIKAATFCGDVYREKGKIQDALQTYQKIIDSYPESIGAQISEIRMANLGIEYKGAKIKDPNQLFQAFQHPISSYKKLMQKKSTDIDLAHLAEYKLGVYFQKKENHAEAIHIFQSVLKKNPEVRIYQNSLLSLKESLVKYLNQCFLNKKYFEVIKIYEKNKYLLDFFLHETKNPTTYFMVACSYQNLDFYLSALNLYQQSKEIDNSLCPENRICDQIQLHLGQIFFQTKEYQKALDAIKKIRGKSDPSLTFNTLTLKGDIYYEQKDYTKTIEMYLAALKIQQPQQEIEYFFKISQCYQKLEDSDNVILFLNKAVDSAQKKKNSSQLVKIYLNLAFHHYKAQNYSKALKIYQKLETMPLSSEDKDWTLFQSGNCSQRQVKLKEALHTFEKLKSSTQDPMWSIITDLKKFEITQIK